MDVSNPSTLPRVAIVGANGLLGKHVLTALLSPRFRDSYSDVVVLRRPSSSDTPIPGATLCTLDEDNLAASFQDIDVLICTVGPAGHAFKDKMISALVDSPVKLYIPSEFGVDHAVHDFAHVEWDHKKLHFEMTQKLIPEIQVVRIFIGLFTEESIGPWFGFHTRDAWYECVGSADAAASYTALEDVGKVVCQVARMEIGSCPGILHIGGDTVSNREIASVMEEAGSESIKITELDLREYKQETVSGRTTDPSRYLRFLTGEGKIDHSSKGLGNDNEIVNAGERFWKWKTMKDYAAETGGKPWADFNWRIESIQ